MEGVDNTPPNSERPCKKGVKNGKAKLPMLRLALELDARGELRQPVIREQCRCLAEGLRIVESGADRLRIDEGDA